MKIIRLGKKGDLLFVVKTGRTFWDGHAYVEVKTYYEDNDLSFHYLYFDNDPFRILLCEVDKKIYRLEVKK